MTRFINREDAGRRLASLLGDYTGRGDVLVLGLPRGGVPIAKVVATHLQAPLEAFIVRKLGVPGQEELAMGAVASGGVRVMNTEVMRMFPNAESLLEATAKKELIEMERREKSYRGGRPFLDVTGRTVIIVDDGIATGATVLAAVRALRKLGAGKLIVAAPVGAPPSCRRLEEEADSVVCVARPESFCAVGEYYEDFHPMEDEEVLAALR